MDSREIRLEEQDRQHKQRAMITSTVINGAILLLLMLPLLTYPVPPPGPEGILVSLGMLNQGRGDDRPDTQNEKKEEPKPPVEEKKEEKKVDPVKEPVKPAKTQPAPAKQQKVLTTEDPEAVAMKKRQKEEADKKAAEEKARKVAEEQARKQAEEEARQKAEAEAKEKEAYEAAKKQYGDSFGKGKGNTSKPGNQGDPNGDPDASKLEGISNGTGKIGGGLGGRGLVYEPVIRDNSQKTGTVVVKVCVNKDGTVQSADYTLKGSTTTDSQLKDIAVRSAQKFKFTTSSVDQQCGTITFTFVVK